MEDVRKKNVSHSAATKKPITFEKKQRLFQGMDNSAGPSSDMAPRITLVAASS